MPYGSLLADVVQSSATGTPPQFNDGNGTQTGTLCRAWVNFNGSTPPAIRASFNVSSVTRNAAGDFTVNFTNAFADTNYAALVSAGNASGTPNIDREEVVAYTTTTCRMFFVNSGVANVDPTYANFAVFR